MHPFLIGLAKLLLACALLALIALTEGIPRYIGVLLVGVALIAGSLLDSYTRSRGYWYFPVILGIVFIIGSIQQIWSLLF